MDFFSSGLNDFLSGSSSVVTDNSYGAPDMQTETPAGNGTGEFLSGSAGFLKDMLNYSLAKDTIKLKSTAIEAQSRPPLPKQPKPFGAMNSQQGGNTLLYVGLGVAAVVLVLVLKR